MGYRAIVKRSQSAMRAVSDTRLRSIRALHPHFVILRYRIAPLPSSTTA